MLVQTTLNSSSKKSFQSYIFLHDTHIQTLQKKLAYETDKHM